MLRNCRKKNSVKIEVNQRWETVNRANDKKNSVWIFRFVQFALRSFGNHSFENLQIFFRSFIFCNVVFFCVGILFYYPKPLHQLYWKKSGFTRGYNQRRNKGSETLSSTRGTRVWGSEIFTILLVSISSLNKNFYIICYKKYETSKNRKISYIFGWNTF